MDFVKCFFVSCINWEIMIFSIGWNEVKKLSNFITKRLHFVRCIKFHEVSVNSKKLSKRQSTHWLKLWGLNCSRHRGNFWPIFSSAERHGIEEFFTLLAKNCFVCWVPRNAFWPLSKDMENELCAFKITRFPFFLCSQKQFCGGQSRALCKCKQNEAEWKGNNN